MKVYYNGCLFESQAELKYALIIEDEYAYILHPKRIFDTFYSTNGKIVEIDEYTKSYKPDFLIRSYKDNTAGYIEIKREGFKDQEQIDRRNRIMEKYLNSLPTPLTFEWVLWNDTMISKEKLIKFNEIITNQHYEQKFHDRLKDIYERNGKIPYTFMRRWSDKEYRDFVIHGTNPIENNF